MLHDFGGMLARPLDTFFGLIQFYGHGSWLMCEVALRYTYVHIGCRYKEAFRLSSCKTSWVKIKLQKTYNLIYSFGE
jgi:hypothetical protein